MEPIFDLLGSVSFVLCVTTWVDDHGGQSRAGGNISRPRSLGHRHTHTHSLLFAGIGRLSRSSLAPWLGALLSANQRPAAPPRPSPRTLQSGGIPRDSSVSSRLWDTLCAGRVTECEATQPISGQQPRPSPRPASLCRPPDPDTTASSPPCPGRRFLPGEATQLIIGQ